jgi:hypothetical protein
VVSFAAAPALAPALLGASGLGMVGLVLVGVCSVAPASSG